MWSFSYFEGIFLGGTKFCVNEICMIRVHWIGVKVPLYYGLILHWITKSKNENTFFDFTLFIETLWNFLKLSETLWNFLSKLSLETSCDFKILETSHLYPSITIHPDSKSFRDFTKGRSSYVFFQAQFSFLYRI